MTQILSPVVWPPAYKIKKHRRAKHVNIKTAQHGLTITVPYRFKLRELPFILEQHKTWILQQLSQWQSQSTADLPDQITLLALKEKWMIRYIASDAKLEILLKLVASSFSFASVACLSGIKNNSLSS